MQFKVNGSISQDYDVKSGTEQGDQKSAFAFNVTAAPLNHFLAFSDEVPRYIANGIEVSPVFFADDILLLLDGSRIN